MTEPTDNGPNTTEMDFTPARLARGVQDLPSGTLLMGMYRIEHVIAAGGFGITYFGEDNLGRKLAIKESFPAGMAVRDDDGQISPVTPGAAPHWEKAKDLFLREARTIAALKHPGVVHVQSLFEANGTAYMAMDYVDGNDMVEVVARDYGMHMPSDVVMGVLDQLLDAIGYIHSMGVLHRDIKPNNIRITHEGAPVLIDFGAARRDTLADRELRKFSSFRIVADGYSPSEFYIAGVEPGTESDLYSLAATFHFAITGEAPDAADSRAASIANDAPDPYRPLAGRIEGYDARLLSLLDAALCLRRSERPKDVAAWRAWLKADGVAPSVATDAGHDAEGLPSAQDEDPQTTTVPSTPNGALQTGPKDAAQPVPPAAMDTPPDETISPVSSTTTATAAATGPETTVLSTPLHPEPSAVETTIVTEPPRAPVQEVQDPNATPGAAHAPTGPADAPPSETASDLPPIGPDAYAKHLLDTLQDAPDATPAPRRTKGAGKNPPQAHSAPATARAQNTSDPRKHRAATAPTSSPAKPTLSEKQNLPDPTFFGQF